VTLQETRARHAAASVRVAARLRANARTTSALPLDVREEIAALAESGMPQMAEVALDGALATQEATA
jgi:hypothetical protein